MVLCWLLNSLSESIRNSVLYFKTARELWCDLEERFGQSNIRLGYFRSRKMFPIYHRVIWTLLATTLKLSSFRMKLMLLVIYLNVIVLNVNVK